MPRRALAALPAAVIVAALALPSPALAGNAFNEVFKNFEANGGAINPCTLSDATLKAALGEIPNDLQQYASDIERAIKQALSARARGACDKVAQTPPPSTTSTTVTPAPPSSSSTPPSTGTGTPAAKPKLQVQTPPAPPASAAASPDTGTAYPANTVAAHTSAGPPAALLILGGLAALMALVALVAVVGRALGFEPRWSLGVRHAFAEAGYRTAGVWAEFTDWVRLGR